MPSRNSPYTGAQRLVKLYEYLLTGSPVRPTEYAAKSGVRRQTVYHELGLLSSAGIPVVSAGYGLWTLVQFVKQVSDNDGLY